MMATNQYSVIVTDMQMSNMNGLELLKKVKEKCPDTVCIMLTGNSDQGTAVNAVNIGDVFKFICKPCDNETLIRTIQSGITQHNLIIAEKVLLNKTLKGVINVLSDVLSLVNPDAMEDNTKILGYLKSLMKVLKIPYSWSIEPMVQLSQLGCVIFPKETIRNIENGTNLSEEEKQLFAQHPCLASDLIRRIPRMENIAENILYQEKCYNGEGIPMNDVKGKDIPIGARMLKVIIDYISFEKKENSIEEAFARLEQQQQYYDPKVLAAFKIALNITIDSPTKEVNFTALTGDMVIHENIITKRGQLVARQGQRVTDTLLHIVNHCLENKALEGTIEVSLISESECESANE